MKFRKKITFSIIVYEILLESLVCSFPYTFSSNSHINDPECETLNFQDNKKSPIQCKSQLKCFPKYNYIKDKESSPGEHEFVIPPEFSSVPNYRELSNFPEVEYPLSATEMWKPNYWTSYSTDYLNKNVMDCVNSVVSEHFSKKKSMPNYETKFNSGIFSTKSLSDSRKNFGSLKNLNDFKNDSSYNNTTRSKNENIPLDNSKLRNFDTTVPLYPLKNASTYDVNLDVCLKDKNVLEHSSNPLTIDDVSYLTSHPEVFFAFSEIFRTEIESIVKAMDDNVISTNLESSKNKHKEPLKDNFELNLTFINDVAERFDKDMNLIIKTAADNLKNEFDLTEKINNTNYHLIPDFLCKEKTTSKTGETRITDVCTDIKDYKMNTTGPPCKETIKNEYNMCSTFNDLSSKTISENDMTCKKEIPAFCKSEADINNEMIKEGETLIPARDTGTQNIVQSVSDNSDNEIYIEEDFTTDCYPENNESSYALSTVAPKMSNIDTIWRDTNVIEPEKSLAYPDELDQYFILNSD